MSDACTLLKDPEACSSITTDDAIQLCYTFKVDTSLLKHGLHGRNYMAFIYISLQITQARLDELNDEYDRKNGRIDMGSPLSP
jgi:hypothetical protein